MSANHKRLYEEWLDFHTANPIVYKLICEYVEQVIRSGRRKYAISPVWERIRWHMTIEMRKEEFALPNNHRAYYARLWLRDHPEYPDFFQICSLRSEGEGAPYDRWGRDRDDLEDDDPFNLSA